MSKHTPGPWLIRKDGTNSGRCSEVYVEGAYYDDGSEFVVADCGTVEVGRNDHWTRTNEAPERDANARLIATSPELLGWARTEFASRVCVCKLNPLVGGPVPCQTCQLESLIAKAEGK